MSDVMFPVEMIYGVPVVGTPSEIDVTNAGQFRAALVACTARGAATIVVDMSQTHFCDSSGLHALVAAHKRVRAGGGELRLVIPVAGVLRVFAISGLDRVFSCHSDLDRALALSRPRQPSPVR
jgi:anti-sigma B factor antagonist